MNLEELDVAKATTITDSNVLAVQNFTRTQGIPSTAQIQVSASHTRFNDTWTDAQLCGKLRAC